MVNVVDSKISVPSDLGEGGPQILTIATNIGDEIQSLQQQLAPLTAEWVGQAADGHQVTQQDWNNAAQSLLTDVGTLGSIAKAMGVNWNNYVDTENANIQSWQT